MPRPGVGNPGNKGGGRKSAREERLIVDVINKSWARIARNLEQNRLTDKEKDLVALELVKKTAPKSMDIKLGGGEDGNQPILVKFLDVKPEDNRDTPGV